MVGKKVMFLDDAIVLAITSEATASLPLLWQFLVVGSICTTIEYLASLVLEKSSGIRMWDYSDEPYNLHGRIALKYSLYWCFIGGAGVRWLMPMILDSISAIQDQRRWLLVAICAVVYLPDLVASARRNSSYHQLLQKISTRLQIPTLLLLDLQFNRTRIVNRSQRIRKLEQDPKFLATKQATQHLFNSSSMIFAPVVAEVLKELKQSMHLKLLERDHRGPPWLRADAIRRAEIASLFADACELNVYHTAKAALLCDFFPPDESTTGLIIGLIAPRYRAWWQLKASALLGDSDRIIRDAVLRYQWPFTMFPPSTLECICISLADDFVDSCELRFALADLYKNHLQWQSGEGDVI